MVSLAPITLKSSIFERRKTPMEKERTESERTEPVEASEEFQPEAEFTPRPWRPLSDVLGTKNPLYEKTLFLQGFDYSSNIYVILGDYLTIVDPGNDYTSYMELFKLGIDPQDIKKIVLTHGHRDHSMGVFELIRSYPSVMENGGLEIMMHQEGPQEFKMLLGAVDLSTTELSGGETIELSGFDFEVVYTPGHTIDGLCFYHAPTRTAITGDTVLPHAMVEADKRAGGSLDYYLFGLRLLRNMEIDNILPGHGDPVASVGKEVIEKTYEHAMMEIAELSPGTSWAQGAAALAGKGLLEEALFCCERALVQNPEDPMTLQIKAICLNDLGRCEEAIEAFDGLLGEKSDNVFAVTGKGCALLGLGKYEESIEYFDRAVEINPEMRDAMMFKGMALYLSGRYEEAMDIEGFREEFVERFKDELGRQKQSD